MREIVASRGVGRYDTKQTFFFEDGVFGYEYDIHSRRRLSYRDKMDFKRAIGGRLFGDTEYLIGLTDDFMDRVIKECVGKTEEEIARVTGRYRTYREIRRAERDKGFEKWAELREKFGGVVIGIDSEIDVYDVGFSCRVLFNTDLSFSERGKFLRENRVEFVRWVMSEISDSKGIKRKIGDIRFYRPVEMVNLRMNEVEVKFEVKKEVV